MSLWKSPVNSEIGLVAIQTIYNLEAWSGDELCPTNIYYYLSVQKQIDAVLKLYHCGGTLRAAFKSKKLPKHNIFDFVDILKQFLPAEIAEECKATEVIGLGYVIFATKEQILSAGIDSGHIQNLPWEPTEP